jgi:Flp pilus assembly protein TadB
MATRTPQRDTGRQTNVRSSGTGRDAGDDWTVFRPMKEFWLWVIVVTLIIFCLMGLSFAIVYTNAQIKKVDALVLRMEQKEKKREKDNRDLPGAD